MSLSVHQLAVHKSGRCLLDIPRLDLEAGQVHALLGPNGAGKSTLLASLAGLERGGSRQVRLHGRLLADWDTLALARRRALLSQDHSVPFDFEVRDIVRMGRYPHSERPHPAEAGVVDECLALAGAAHLAGRRYEPLSGGEKARVQLARVLAQVHAHPDDLTPCWLLLDEPTAALDLAHQHGVMRLLRRVAAAGVGVVVVLHDINLAAAYADQVLVMAHGRIDSAGACAQVLQPQLVQRVWGVVCQRLALPDAPGSWLAFS